MAWDLPEKRIHMKGRADSFTFCHLTDLHIGTAACNEKQLKADIQTIKDNGWGWFGGGDYIEAISPSDRRRWDSGIVAPWIDDPEDAVQIQAEYAADLLRPIADQCMGLLIGNHEWTARKYGNFSPYRFIVRELAAARGEKVNESGLALGWGDYFALRFSRSTNNKKSGRGAVVTTILHLHHGHGSAGVGLPGNYALKLGRELDNFPSAMLILRGHLHVRHYVEKVHEVVAQTKIKKVTRMGFFVPGYLETRLVDRKTDKVIPPQTYAQERGYGGASIGTFPITIKPYHGEISAELKAVNA